MSTDAPLRFRLYVAGEPPHSLQAMGNLSALCVEHLPGRHEIEIVDGLREQRRALADGVLLTPLLVKLSPAPVRKITGCLAERAFVLEALGLPLSP